MTQKELEFFQQELIKEADKIKENIQNARCKIELMRNQSPTDEGDYALLTNDSSIEQAIIEQLVKELEEIEIALKKIKKGNYGICEMCEDEIGIERLKIKPHAKYCITCREIIEKSK